MKHARESVGMKDGADASKTAVKWFVEKIMEIDERHRDRDSITSEMQGNSAYAEHQREYQVLGENILSSILAEMGDISRFDDVKEIQKLSGLGLVACSSGKHKRKKPRSVIEDANGLDIGCSRRRGLSWSIQRNSENFMSTIRRGQKIRLRKCSR